MEFLLIAIVIVILGFILANYFKNPGDDCFDLTLRSAREEFLQRSFDITKQDCERLHFDGRHFYHRRECPYENYTGIQLIGSEQAVISNPALPHRISWKYQRLDGGPDLRYRGNVKAMHSKRHFVHFDGKKPFTLHVYSYPEFNDVSQLLIKFDAFLCGAQDSTYESDFNSFEAASIEKKLATKQLSDASTTLASCDAVAIAHSELLKSTVITEALNEKVSDAATKRSRALEQVVYWRKEILKHQQQEELAVLSAKRQSKIAFNQRTISRF